MDVVDCTITPDGLNLVSASYDETLKVWDVRSQNCLATLEGHDSAVMACALASDGLTMFSSSNDGTMMVWDMSSKKPLARSPGCSSLSCCALTRDDLNIVTGDRCGEIKLWSSVFA